MQAALIFCKKQEKSLLPKFNQTFTQDLWDFNIGNVSFVCTEKVQTMKEGKKNENKKHKNQRNFIDDFGSSCDRNFCRLLLKE